MAEKEPIRALVFDAYGTLFDVHSIGSACESLFPGKGADLSRLWRAKQLEYAWLRSLMGRYADFESITRDALGVSCLALGLKLSQSDEQLLMDGYRNLKPFPDVPKALTELSGCRKSILSNGSPGMLHDVVKHAGLAQLFDAVLSVDALRIFKPHPSVYELAHRQLDLDIAQIGFVSSNFWDIAGATSYGFRTFWINRVNGCAEKLGFQPYAVISDLSQIGPLLG